MADTAMADSPVRTWAVVGLAAQIIFVASWLLAGAWRRSTNDGLTYSKVLRHLLAADTELGTGYGPQVAQAFAARGIAA